MGNAARENPAATAVGVVPVLTPPPHGDHQASNHPRETKLSGWGRTLISPAEVVEVGSIAGILRAIETSRTRGKTLVGRGSGYSYGDVALNRNNVVLDMRPMRRVLAWDPLTGVIDVEPGVTVGELCQHVASSGWWPPVIPGASEPTLGGCVAVNAHGKSNWKAGPIGEHVRELDIVLADGTVTTCGPGSNESLFRSIVGGFGLLGIMTRIRLRMEPTANVLHVEQFAAPQLEDVLAILDRWQERASSMVAWLDGFATGQDLGRGLVQIADALPPSESVLLHGNEHGLTSRLFDTSRSKLWMGMKPIARNAAFKRLNALQFMWGTINSGKGTFVPRSRFEFFHDAVPHWNRAFGGGIVQYQIFVPAEKSAYVFRSVLEHSQIANFPPFLAVMKRHRRDNFLLSYGVDGHSLSLDFHPGWTRLAELTEHLRNATDEHVLPAGGRFYLAKDSILMAHQIQRSLGTEAVSSFLHLKHQVDPDVLFQSDLYRRAFLGCGQPMV